MCWPQASSRFMCFLLAWVSQREQRVASAVVLLLHRGLLWQKGKIREFFPSILFHSLGKKTKNTKPNNKTDMPVISCRSGTALLIYFKVSFRTVCLISTLHGAALPKGGKAPLPGKLVFVFSFLQDWMPSASSHQTLEKGSMHLKEAGWLGQQQSWLLPAVAPCLGC